MNEHWVDRSGMCPCCSGKAVDLSWGVVSAFLAKRAFGESPSPVQYARCKSCGHAWATRGLTAEQAGKLYEGYRQEEYFKQRSGFEPWYTRAANGEMGSEEEMVKRRGVLADALGKAQEKLPKRQEGIAFDFGGDRGQMLRDLPDKCKVVHDMSGVASDPWARQAGSVEAWEGRCDLVLNCQVLEHADDPAAVLSSTVKLAKPGGWVYVEVPDESWKSFPQMPDGARQAWLGFICSKPRLLMAMDFASTGCRRTLGWIPPLGFWAMREHLNFFTLKSLGLAMKAAGLDVVCMGGNDSGLSGVGRKPSVVGGSTEPTGD